MTRRQVAAVFPLWLSWALAGCSSESPVAAGADSAPYDASVEDAAPEAQAEEDGDAGQDATMGQCSVAYTDAACGACMDERCCGEALDKAMVPDTDAFAACRDACADDDTACQAQCSALYPEGYVRYGPWAACMRHECTEPCAIPKEASCGLQLTDPDCDLCARQECCEEGYRTILNPEYHALVVCEDGCSASDTDCILQCIGEHPEGYRDSKLFETCLEIECTDACETALGGSYPCGYFAVTPQACETCVFDSCCEEIKARLKTGDYWMWLACHYGCGGDQTCQAQCMYAHVPGYGQSLASSGCIYTRCPDDCASYGSKPCGGIDYLSPACKTCMEASCCDELTAQGLSVEGEEYVWCSYACSNQSMYDFDSAICQAECMAQYPDGYTLSRVVNGCMWDHCATTCGVTVPACGLGFDQESACGACVEANCCDEAKACTSGFDCTRIDLCRYLTPCEPTDSACLATCKAANPAGAPAFDEWMACEAASCASECMGE